jgi:outer membrane murein-binding lipoprotein Lpp
VGAWLLANTNWNNLSTQVGAAVIAGAILAGAGSLLANDKVVGPWLPKRPWVASTFTAFSTAIIAAAVVWSVLIVTKGWFRALDEKLTTLDDDVRRLKGELHSLEADKAQLLTDLAGRDPAPAMPHDEAARTYYGTVTIGESPPELGWDPILIVATSEWTPHTFYCDEDYYLIGLILFTEKEGFDHAQIMCSKLIRSPQLTMSHQK